MKAVRLVSVTACAVAVMGGSSLADARNDASPASVDASTPVLGLPRLSASNAPGKAPPLAARSYQIEDLSVMPGSRGQSSRSVQSLPLVDLAKGAVWSRPLRSQGNKPLFVSMLVYASPGTDVRIGAMSFRIAEAQPGGSAMASLLVPRMGPEGMRLEPLGINSTFDLYEGRVLVALPVLTVRLDPVEKTWDLYLGARLAAVGLALLPVAPKAKEKPWHDVALRAGDDGAWVLGVVQASENPLYEDANANAVPDAFESVARRRGEPTGKSAAEDRRDLADAWRRSGEPLPTLVVRPIRPDSK